MTLLKQIDDRGAVLEWSPIPEHANLVALGTKDSAGSGFDDHGGELELHSLDFADSKSSSSTLLGKYRASSRFSSIAWSRMDTNRAVFPYGLIAGGMVDGNIHVWDASKLASGDPDSLLASVEQHQGSVAGLQFNPHKESSHLLASGGSDAEVYVTSLEHPDQPSVFVPAPPPNNAKHTADITKVAWNTQVVHILASAAQNGSCYIWDLRQKKAWCELRDPAGGLVSDVAWNPDQGLHLVTASGDDKNPVIKLWDLRSSTSLPLATLQGHKEGILSVSWCPTDASLLLSCAKDNRTILWDLFNLQPVYDLPSVQSGPAEGDAEGMFGGLAASANQRRSHVSWSPCLPAVVSASSFDRKVQFFSMVGAKSRIGRAPKWLRRPVGATFGFGGKLVTFDSKNQPVNTNPQAKKVTTSALAKIYQVVEDNELVEASDLFHSIVAKGEFKQFCDLKSNSPAVSPEERQVWSLMNVICFGSNAREELLTHLGFDSASITATAQEYVAKTNPAKAPEPVEVAPAVDLDALNINDDTSILTAEDMFSAVPPVPPTHTTVPKTIHAEPVAPAKPPVLPEDIAKTAELWSMIQSGNAAEPTIRRAIIVGNFEAAVECCLEAGLMAEALLLAQCGDQALRVRTQAVFFEKRRHEHPFLHVLHAVIRNELMAYVQASDLSRWKETLALLSTYGKSDEFPALCEVLAGRLEVELRDTSSATLCYMCAANVIRTVGFWTAELNAANAALGRMDTRALENYVEKVVVFTHANPIESLGPECSAFFSKYAELLASQGRLSVALSYLKGQNMAENILIDRLYNAGEKPPGSRPPNFPFPRTPLEAVQQVATPSTPTAKAVLAGANPAATAGVAANKGARGSSTTVNSAALAAATAAASATSNPSAYGANAQQQHHTAVAAAPAAAAGAYVLPAGWLALTDPNSNHTYYVNQATGQSQWEAPPSAAPAPAPVSVAPTPASTAGNFSSAADHMGGASAGAAAHGHPSLVKQTSGTLGYPGAGPATAAAAHTPAVVTPAVAATPAVVTPAAAAAPAAANLGDSADNQYVVYLGQLINNLTAVITAPAEKKQLTSVTSAYEVLVQQTSRGELAPETLNKVNLLVDALSNRNFPGASQIQADLANTVWNQHKDWIKGIKIFIQLASKK